MASRFQSALDLRIWGARWQGCESITSKTQTSRGVGPATHESLHQSPNEMARLQQMVLHGKSAATGDPFQSQGPKVPNKPVPEISAINVLRGIAIILACHHPGSWDHLPGHSFGIQVNFKTVQKRGIGMSWGSRFFTGMSSRNVMGTIGMTYSGWSLKVW